MPGWGRRGDEMLCPEAGAEARCRPADPLPRADTPQTRPGARRPVPSEKGERKLAPRAGRPPHRPLLPRAPPALPRGGPGGPCARSRPPPMRRPRREGTDESSPRRPQARRPPRPRGPGGTGGRTERGAAAARAAAVSRRRGSPQVMIQRGAARPVLRGLAWASRVTAVGANTATFASRLTGPGGCTGGAGRWPPRCRRRASPARPPPPALPPRPPRRRPRPPSRRLSAERRLPRCGGRCGRSATRPPHHT